MSFFRVSVFLPTFQAAPRPKICTVPLSASSHLDSVSVEVEGCDGRGAVLGLDPPPAGGLLIDAHSPVGQRVPKVRRSKVEL